MTLTERDLAALIAISDHDAAEARRVEGAREKGITWASPRPATAQDVARHAGLVGARRLGNGAVKGSWSGRMSPALRIAPTLRRLTKAGLIQTTYDSADYRNVHRLTPAGVIAADQARLTRDAMSRLSADYVRQTMRCSTASHMQRMPAWAALMDAGQAAVPALLHTLEAGEGGMAVMHALAAITGIWPDLDEVSGPVADGDMVGVDVSAAAAAWVRWGRERQLLT